MGGDSLHCCYREQVAYALYARFREPKLYRYVSSGDWDLIPARCQSHPKEASFVHKYAPNDTVLHHLLRFQQDDRHCLSCQASQNHDNTQTSASTHQQPQQDEDRLEEKWKLDAVEALIRASPNAAVTRPDAFGKTPLHLACTTVTTCSATTVANEATCDESICLSLLRAYPRAASLVDSIDKRTPLHYLVARNHDVSLIVLKALLKAAPSSVHAMDVTGDTAMDIVQARRAEISNASVVLQILKQAEATTPKESGQQQQGLLQSQRSSSRLIAS